MRETFEGGDASIGTFVLGGDVYPLVPEGWPGGQQTLCDVLRETREAIDQHFLATHGLIKLVVGHEVIEGMEAANRWGELRLGYQKLMKLHWFCEGRHIPLFIPRTH